MFSNRLKRSIKLETRVKCVGDWNGRNILEDKKNLPRVLTKPLGLVTIGDDEVVFTHSDIMKLIEVYHLADKKAIKMIRDPDTNTGLVKSTETPFLKKIKDFIKEIEEEEERQGLMNYI